MKTESILKIIVAILPLLFLSSCSGKGDKYAFQYVTFKQTLPYEPGKENPRCNFDMRVLQAYGTDTMFADAFNKDPAFYDFYRAMQSYDVTFAQKGSSTSIQGW